MYEIFAGNAILFSDVTPAVEYKVISPKLTMEDNCAGSLEFTMPPQNAMYDTISCLNTELMVKQDGVEIWRGRVISDSLDFWKNKKIVAEGELAYLNDSIQPPKKYVTTPTPSKPVSGVVYNTTVKSFLKALLEIHNSQVGGEYSNKGFSVEDGDLYVAPELDGDQLDDNDAINRFTNFETTLECVLDKLVSRLGGHLRIRHITRQINGKNVDVRCLDYLKDYIDASYNQTIQFGSNLLDFVRDIDSTEWVTAVIPRGKRKDEEEIEGLEAYTTAEKSTIIDTWHARNSTVVKNPTTNRTYGFICTVVDWENVTDPDTLVKKAKKYLESVQFNKMVIEVSTVDLHYLNPDIDTFKMLSMVTCISDAHGMNSKFPVTKMEIDLLDPGNTTYTLGSEVFGNISSTINRFSNEVYDYIDDTHIPVESVILNSAKGNAQALIEGTLDGGYASFIYGTDFAGVPITDDEGVVTHPDRPTGITVRNSVKEDTSVNRWLWTYGGLMHQQKDTQKKTWKLPNVALTMDGSIVADRITSGVLTLTGSRTQSVNPNTNPNATPKPSVASLFMKVFNGNNEIGRWSSEGIYVRSGTIWLGEKLENAITYKNAKGGSPKGWYPLILNDDGSALFKYATLTEGCKVGAATINKDGVLGNFGTSASMAGMKIGDGTFGISVPSRYNPTGSWGGIAFGYEAYEKCGWGNTSCILWDAAEESGSYAQGGFFVVRGDPGHGDNEGNYSKQTYNTFQIVRGGSSVANFNEDFYNKVMILWDER